MKTTAKDFERFKAEFVLWQKALGLMDWHVYFRHEALDEGLAACIRSNCESKMVSVFLGFVADIGQTPEQLARHEALELLLSDLEDVARSRYIRPDDVVQNRHAIIRRLENLFDQWEKP